jgi:hypothetical protein
MVSKIKFIAVLTLLLSFLSGNYAYASMSCCSSDVIKTDSSNIEKSSENHLKKAQKMPCHGSDKSVSETDSESSSNLLSLKDISDLSSNCGDCDCTQCAKISALEVDDNSFDKVIYSFISSPKNSLISEFQDIELSPPKS